MTISLDVTTNMILELVIKLLKLVIIMGCTRLIIKQAIPGIMRICSNNNVNIHTTHMITKTTRYIFMIFGSTIALQNIGIEVSTILTLFGITGIVLSYGMKDIVANFIASILIIGYQYIKINDIIQVKGIQGTVVDINLRYTTLQADNKTIYIPNIILYTEAVIVINKQ